MPLRRSIVAATTWIGVSTVVLAACSGGGSGSSERTGTAPTRSTSHRGPAPGAGGSVTTTDAAMATPDGRRRTYRLVVPDSVRDAGAVPLLVALHGGLGSGIQFERTSGFDDLATEHRFIVVYPDGIPVGGTGILRNGRVWNGGRCCGRAARERVDDVGFIASLIDRVSAEHRIDPRRVYVTGHSNGAILAYRLACQLSERVAAIGLQAGSIEIDPCAPAHPVSVLAIHGLADTNIPIEGGKGTGISPTPFSSPTEAVHRFATFDGCAQSSRRTDATNPDVDIETWTGGRAGTEVEFIRVATAPHAWMGHPSPRGASAGANQPYPRFDSSTAIWDFLAAHPRQ